MESEAIIRILDNSDAVASEAAALFTQLANAAAQEGRPFRVALSGGSTPKLLYGVLASDQYCDKIKWDQIEFFLGDERFVPHDSPDSNYKLANDYLFTRVPVDQSKVHPVPTQGVSPEQAAEEYEGTLRQVFGTPAGEVPVFDLTLQGMGDDGHTASCFPHTQALHEQQRLVVPNYVPKLNMYRITLTIPVLRAASQVVFMVTGAGKAPALSEVLEGDDNIEEYPSQMFRQAKGTVTWLVDREAAAQLRGAGQAQQSGSQGAL